MAEHSRRRLTIVAVMLSTIAVVVLGRLTLLQIAQYPVFAEESRKLNVRITEVEPPRGRIFDRNMELVATNVDDFEVDATPHVLTDTGAVANFLSPLLGIPEAGLLKTLQDNKDADYVVLAQRVPGKVGEAIRERGYYGLMVSPKSRRVYPLSSLMAHITGFVAVGDQTGYGGVEGYYQKRLTGEAATGEQWTDPLGVSLDPQPVVGSDLVLTVDREAQFAATEVLSDALKTYQAKSGTIIAMDPRDGSILAMVSLPTFDPNVVPGPADWDTRRDPAVSEIYEPGSVFKILTIAIALNDGIVTPDTTYVDTGVIDVGGAIIHNWDGGAYGVQDMRGLLAHSLNVGASWVNLHTGPDRFYSGLKAFGLGELTGVDLAGEVSGHVKLPGDPDWHEADLGTNSFGQGVSTTPLEMLTAAAGVINGGRMMQPHVVARIREGGHWRDYPPQLLSHPISEKTSAEMRGIMAQAVETEILGAKVPGYKIGGKTGTAQIPRGGIYDPDATIASFIGFLPADDPQLIVLVKLDEPQTSPWGSTTAAPTFAKLAQRLVALLQIPPDDVRAQAR